ncbi:MAG: CheR family methyltransferase [Cyanobacteria bacterium P01_H01_bin.15]
MDRNLKARFTALLETETGIAIRGNDWPNFRRKLELRAKAAGFEQLLDYYQLLSSSESSIAKKRQAEWQHLITDVTIGETFFFRDRGQFDLLQNTLLPQLIDVRRKEQLERSKLRPTLKVWSAGCASGEELYSIAILLAEMLPDLANWQLVLIGTDISTRSLSQAKKARFTDWSFRQISPTLKERYFRPKQDGWELVPHIHRLVTFEHSNLLTSQYPNQALCDVDLIICRNVFIYFRHAAIAQILNKFKQTLKMGGYLVSGHTELQMQNLKGLAIENHAGSIVYRHQEIGLNLRLKPPSTQLPKTSSTHIVSLAGPSAALTPPQITIKSINIPPKKTSSTTAHSTRLNTSDIKSSDFQTVVDLIENGHYDLALATLQSYAQKNPDHYEVHYLTAKIQANRGNTQVAVYHLRQAQNIDIENPKAYFLLAQIAEDMQDLSAAKTHLRQVIYFQPQYAIAYWRLGLIFEQENNPDKAKKALQEALDNLVHLPANRPVSDLYPYDPPQLQRLIAKKLSR